MLRLIALPGRLWLRLSSPAGIRLLSPIIAALLLFIAWQVWRYAGKSALGRAARWWLAAVSLAVVLGVSLTLLAAPPEDSTDAAAARAQASERAGRAVYTDGVATIGGVAVALSSLFAARSLWLACTPSNERRRIVQEWSALGGRYGRPVVTSATALLGLSLTAFAVAIASASISPAQIPVANPGLNPGPNVETSATHSLWVGTRIGASRLVFGPARAHWEHVQRPGAPLPSDEVTDIAAGQDGSVWIATTGGLLGRLPGANSSRWVRATVETAPLPYPTVLGVAVDRQGNAWAATISGAAGISPDGNGRAFTARTAPLLHQLLDAAYVDPVGRVWFGGVGGVNVYEPPASGDWGALGSWPAGFNKYATGGGLPDNLVFTIFGDSKGRVWFGTDGGAAVFTPDPEAYSLGSTDGTRWRTLGTSASPLVHDKVHAIAEDIHGRVYFGTERGLSILDESAAAGAQWTAIQYHAPNASAPPGSRLPHPYISSIAVGPDGRVWIGTKDGLTVYDPEQPSQHMPVYRSNALRRWTGRFWPPHARQDLMADEITALVWSR